MASMTIEKTTVRVTKTTTSPITIEEIKKNIFVVLEMYNGYTEAEALKNYECVNGQCMCQ